MNAVLLHRISAFRQDEHRNDLLELALVIAFVVLGSTVLGPARARMSTACCNIRALEVAHVHNR
jgi:hypothetical protein